MTCGTINFNICHVEKLQQAQNIFHGQNTV